MEGARAVYEGRASFGDDRGTASDHYKRFAKAGVPGYVLEPDDHRREDDLPDEFEHVIAWHHDIRRRAARGQHFEPILLSEIAAYLGKLARIGIVVEPLEEDLLCRLDDIWMECVPKST